ncbi:MAG: hypothetical protein HY696_10830 [Deltaproteobacteria bacterium]|nr:hypothetical protein [Deltaproteobacteria bacterium]
MTRRVERLIFHGEECRRLSQWSVQSGEKEVGTSTWQCGKAAAPVQYAYGPASQVDGEYVHVGDTSLSTDVFRREGRTLWVERPAPAPVQPPHPANDLQALDAAARAESLAGRSFTDDYVRQRGMDVFLEEDPHLAAMVEHVAAEMGESAALLYGMMFTETGGKIDRYNPEYGAVCPALGYTMDQLAQCKADPRRNGAGSRGLLQFFRSTHETGEGNLWRKLGRDAVVQARWSAVYPGRPWPRRGESVYADLLAGARHWQLSRESRDLPSASADPRTAVILRAIHKAGPRGEAIARRFLAGHPTTLTDHLRDFQQLFVLIQETHR